MSLAEVIAGYGEAWRGDWIDFDGRTLRDDLYTVAGWVSKPDTYPGDDAAASYLGFCNLGGLGHWYEHCDYHHHSEEAK